METFTTNGLIYYFPATMKHHSFIRGFQTTPRPPLPLRHPALDPTYPFYFKIFASPPLFSTPPPF